MESSGTYGDVLRHQLLGYRVPVHRLSGKRVHDAAEVYDGVPSLHDAKSAAIIAKIKRDGGRRARAVIALMRKFAQALFHVARGVPLDSSKLFDVSRLRLT
jgi:hypothetical protein